MDPYSRAIKKNTSRGNELLPQDTTHISYKDHVTNEEVRAKIQQAIGPHEDVLTVVWLCFPFIRSGQNHLARHSERGKKTRQTGEEVGRLHQGMDRPGVRQVPEGSGEQGKMEETGSVSRLRD